MSTFLRSVLRGEATREQAKDTGMAMVLILLLFAFFQARTGYVLAAIGVHVLNMTAPQAFRPAAVVWFGVSHLLGTVASKILLAVVFFVIVTPVGLVRRLLGADSLQLRAFRAGRSSVMNVRNHTFTGKDLEEPY